MASKHIEAVRDEINDVIFGLGLIDFETPTEPRDDASADDWRDFAMDLPNLLTDAQKAVGRAITSLES